MNGNTISRIRSVLAEDPSVRRAQVRAVVEVLTGDTAKPFRDPRPLDGVITRQTVADLLGVSPRTVANYVARGILEPVRLGAKGARALGYSESSVRAALQRRGENHNSKEVS